MSRSFDVSVDSPASVRQVHTAFRDEDYWLARLATFGGSSTLDMLTVDADVPTTAEALARLDMPLIDAMMTQRALRRVLPDPVDDAVVFKCIELALRAPTGADGQNWEFIIVKDNRIKQKLAKRYRQGWKVQ